MKFLLTGQQTFGNRGCEAIVRSTVGALRHKYPAANIFVPSGDIPRDSVQWPDHAAHGVEFVPAYQSLLTRPWVHAQRLPVPALKRAGWPFPFPAWQRELISRADAVLAVGGDNYSLDYRLPSPLIGIDGLAMDMGKPVYLWGASVGPFEREPAFVPAISRHLARMSRIFVRESVSYEYLTGALGLTNVELMVDPAFTLKPEPVDFSDFWPEEGGNGVVGLNVSPLIERYKRPGQSIQDEVVQFVRTLVSKKGFHVLLIPHVIPLDGSEKNNDAIYLAKIMESCRELHGKVRVAPSHLNAAQLKHIIGNVRFFIGARTHATIAALSSGVPTLSISYSVKARGINRDLFGHEDVVLPTSEISSERLLASLDALCHHEDTYRNTLQQVMPAYRKKVLNAVPVIKSMV